MSLNESFYSSDPAATAYEGFSRAQDPEGLVTGALVPFSEGARVLDAGCGTGRFLPGISRVASLCVGADSSPFQLSVCRAKNPEAPLVLTDLSGNIPWGPGTFDTAVSCWVSGTIRDPSRARSFLENLLLCSRTAVLVENATGSEFERIRGRDADGSTDSHLRFLSSMGFRVASRIESRISFPSVEEARNLVLSIWGDRAAGMVCGADIGHDILVLVGKKGG